MNGLPQDKAQLMVNFLQEAAAKRDVAIVAQDFPDSWKLTGDFSPQNEADGTVKVVYGWTLRDNTSQTMHQISGAEPALQSTTARPDLAIVSRVEATCFSRSFAVDPSIALEDLIPAASRLYP